MYRRVLAALSVFCFSALLAVGSSAQNSPEVTVVSQRAGALAEIMTEIEKNSFYKLSEKELNDVQECIAARAFIGFEIKKDALKGDLKVPSCFPQDKRAMYFSPEVTRDLGEARVGHFGGIGMSIGPDKEMRGVVIKELFEGAPAERDGRLKAGDLITAAADFVEGRELKLVPFKGFDTRKAASVMRGEPGTKVALEVWRDGQKLPLIAITREDVKIKNVKASETSPGIGYLKIDSFDSFSVATDVWDALWNFKNKGIKKVIVDLRKNGGGLMNAAIGIASLFAPEEGVLVLEARWRGQKAGEGQKYPAMEIGFFYGFEVAVLIDGLSASASEILAGSLKIWGAKIVGVKSYGKGSIQTQRSLSDGGTFSFTTGLYYLADGKTPEDGGIEPHFVIEDDPRTPEVDEALAVAVGILMDSK